MSASQVNEVRLKNLRKIADKEGGAAAVSRKLGHTTGGYLSQISTGRRPFSEKTARAIEEAYRLERGWLDKEHEGETAIIEASPRFQRIADGGHSHAARIGIRGTVPGGLPVECFDVPPEHYVEYAVRGRSENFYALQVLGDSMNNVAPDGAYLIIDGTKTDPRQLDGKPVIVFANGECTFKRLCLNPNLLMPDSTNKTHKPILLDGDWRVLGLVIGVLTPLDN